jgi:hypothetical protein
MFGHPSAKVCSGSTLTMESRIMAKRVLWGVLVRLMLLSIALLFGECILRIVVSFGAFDNFHPFVTLLRIGIPSQINPNDARFRKIEDTVLGWAPVPGTHGDFRINSHGLRGPEVSRTPPMDHMRIAVVGDSEMFGTVLREEETFPAQLQKYLNESCEPDINIEVLNFGVPGYNVQQYDKLITDKVFKFFPDLIFVAFNLNDIDFGLHSSVFRPPPLIGKLYLYKLAWAVRFFALRKGVVGVSGEDYYLSMYQSRHFDLVKKHLANIAGACSRQDIPAVLMILPPIVPPEKDFEGNYPYGLIHRKLTALSSYGFKVIDQLSSMNRVEKSHGRRAMAVSEMDFHKSGLVFREFVLEAGPVVCQALQSANMRPAS